MNNQLNLFADTVNVVSSAQPPSRYVNQLFLQDTIYTEEELGMRGGYPLAHAAELAGFELIPG